MDESDITVMLELVHVSPKLSPIELNETYVQERHLSALLQDKFVVSSFSRLPQNEVVTLQGGPDFDAL